MRLRSKSCRSCDWTFEGGRVVVYPKLAPEPGPPRATSEGYEPPKWMLVVAACPKCGTPMTFELNVTVEIAGARQLLESEEPPA